MDAIGVAPKGLEAEGGVGDTPLLEMVLPGVTPIPVEEGPKGGQKGSLRDKQTHNFTLNVAHFKYTPCVCRKGL